MIWDPTGDGGAGRSPLVEQLTAQIEAACGGEIGLTESEAAELARAVECYLDRDGQTAVVDARSLILLTARAMSDVGHGPAARRFVLYGTGLVRPAEWVVTRGESMWVLDLRAMAVRDDAPLELIFFNGLGVVIDALADVWDATDGEGVLGMRHVWSAVEGLLGRDVSHRSARAMADEVIEVCQRKLELVGRDRGWPACPRVMNLDE